MAIRDADEDEVLNEVRLIGKVPALAQERVLPSGDVLCTFRVAVARDPAPAGSHTANGSSRRGFDSLECSSWTGRVRRSAMSWQVGDVVEVSGAIRRRFFRTANGTASRVEVEVTTARRLRRPGS